MKREHGTELPHTWCPFMARVALLPETADEEPKVEAQDSQAIVRALIEGEGGRIIDFFWYEPFGYLGEEMSSFRLIVVFEARSQYPIWRNQQLSLEAYVRPPSVEDREPPSTVDPQGMAESIKDAINRSGAFFVTELERWARTDDVTSAGEDWDNIGGGAIIARAEDTSVVRAG